MAGKENLSIILDIMEPIKNLKKNGSRESVGVSGLFAGLRARATGNGREGTA